MSLQGFFGSRADRRGTDAELAMDLDLDFSERMEGIRNALAAFVSHARKAGLDAPVPTAPEWTVRDLVVHQGMVHRWAAAHVRGKEPTRQALDAEGMAVGGPGDLAARRRPRPDQGDCRARQRRPRGAWSS